MGKMSHGEKLTRALSLNPLPTPPHPTFHDPLAVALGGRSPPSLGIVGSQPAAPRSPCRMGNKPRAVRKRWKRQRDLHTVPSSGLQTFLLAPASSPLSHPYRPPAPTTPQLLPFPSCASPPLATSGCLSFASSKCFSLKPLNILKFQNIVCRVWFTELMICHSHDHGSIHDPLYFTH